MATTTANRLKKSTDCTVFVRFIPSSSSIRRHHLEDLFSDIGPIKKSSVIHNQADDDGGGVTHGNKSASYGFVKYTTQEDAEKAAKKLNNKTLTVSDTEKVKVKVELASKQHQQNRQQQSGKDNSEEHDEDTHVLQKKKCRLILRNLSFYAKESHIREALQGQFGEVVEVHIPTVAKAGTHRGFAFVTFAREADAKKCVQTASVEIKNRPVQIAYSLSKNAFESQKGKDNTKQKGTSKEMQSRAKEDKQEDDEMDAEEEAEDDMDAEDDGHDSVADDDQSEDDSSGNDDDASAESKTTNQLTSQTVDETAVSEKRSVFVRNLPFDATRHDLFETFRKFGHITSIFLVKDKATGIPKGTAFVAFRTALSAKKACKVASNRGNSFVSQKESNATDEANLVDETGVSLNGRRLLVDLAVDKGTATTLTVDKKSDGKALGKDRRYLYLKGEGRVDNEGDNKAWDELPESDQAKRQRAWSDKNTKLRSPLFFINPLRLSVRNLAKHVDESALKKLCVQATMRGLSKKLVRAEDQIAHWRASGDMTTRDILSKIEELGGDKDKDAIIPEFDEKNIKLFIPSVFIDRDFSGAPKKGVDAPSRGFGFVEFNHHAHAVACLRELNNNTAYTAEYANGGKHASDVRRKSLKKRKSADLEGPVLLPRLIVEFTVENKAKAKQQSEHRAQQMTNYMKQKEAHKEADSVNAESKRKSRGARQRDRKRRLQAEGHNDSEQSAENLHPTAKTGKGKELEETVPRLKPVKPIKKRKVDQEERKFDKLVESHKRGHRESDEGAVVHTTETKKTGKRWFES